jgi:DNA-binding IclR family transcriptional regulator
MAGNSNTPGATVIQRVLRVLDCFDPKRTELTLSEIATVSELPISTARRIITQLGELGALERLVDNRYRVGMRLWNIGILAPQQRNIREAALPSMYDLYTATNETVQLVVTQGTQALCIEKVFGPKSAPTATEVGGKLPLHATAVGKCILAHSQQQLLQAIVAAGLKRRTPYTITQPARLIAELKQARREGVAYSREEMTTGAASVAAPILGPGGILRGALGIVARSTTRVDNLAPAVKTAALTIARLSG